MHHNRASVVRPVAIGQSSQPRGQQRSGPNQRDMAPPVMLEMTATPAVAPGKVKAPTCRAAAFQAQRFTAQITSAMVVTADAAMHSTAVNLLKLNCLPLPGKACADDPVESGMLVQSGK